MTHKQARKLLKALLFPPVGVPLALVPVSAAALVGAFLYMEEASPVRIAAYVLSFYTLVVCCLRLPLLARRLNAFKQKSPLLRRWFADPHFKNRVTLRFHVLWNTAYACFQLGLGAYYRSAWFLSVALYYFSLAFMRFFLVREAYTSQTGVQTCKALDCYRLCGRVFLVTNVAFSSMIFYMLKENRAVHHHEITVIAMAAYTFTSLTLAIVGFIRLRRKSRVLSASRSITLAAALVSLLTLEETMLNTFRTESMTPRVRWLFLALSGGAVSLFLIHLAVLMLLRSEKKK